MSILLTLTIGLFLILLGKHLFSKWFNHWNIYVLSWTIYISLYELKLMRFIALSNEVWFIMIFSTLSYLFGILTIFAARISQDKNKNIFSTPKEITLDLFRDNGRTLVIIILVSSLIGFLTAIIHWAVLINRFGSIVGVIIQANIVYKLRVEGDISEPLPYLYIFSYVGIFFSGIYTAYKNRISFVALLPLIAIVLKEMAAVGRAGILLGLLEFILSLFLFRHFLSVNKVQPTSGKKNIVIALIIFAIVAIAGASIVKSFRGSIESYQASGQVINKLKGGMILSPSVYLYLSSNIGVLSKYLEEGGEDLRLGENTFFPIYNFLSKFDIVKRPKAYPKGYYIPMWTNSATYLRELHADFGYTGVFLIPYLLGLFTTFYWFRFYEIGKMKDFILLVYLTIAVTFSSLVLVTRIAAWSFSLFFLIFLITWTEKIIRNKQILRT